MGNSAFECTLGEVRLTGGSFAIGIPADGRLLSTSTYSALFAVLGTKFGGDGNSTFGLPDLRAITPNGMVYSVCVSGNFPSQN